MKHLTKRILSLLLVVALLAGFAVPAQATGNHNHGNVTVNRVDNSAVSGSLLNQLEELQENQITYADTDMVRVSIQLEKASTIEAGYSTKGITENVAAMAYRDTLKDEQATMTARIEKALGGPLDVQWNLTVAANIISANVAFGDIEAIEAIDGVKQVILETRYEPQTAEKGETVSPNMTVSVQMTGTNLAWTAGYTGAGSRIAVVDTGADLTHQSLDPEAFAFALAEDAGLAGMEYEEYLEKINVLDEEELALKLSQLNAYARYEGLTAADVFENLKAPFIFNYIDADLDVLHINDSQGEHGSHVAGIATANRYLEVGENEFAPAAETVGVVGNAPDAQLLVMKVFGKGGGAYDSDYFAAIEDAIILNADAVNLSLGSGNPGMTTNATYQDLLDYFTETDTVMSMSAGNSGYWSESSNSPTGTLYLDDVSWQTNGSPGSYTNSLSVASVDNDGSVGASINVAGVAYGYNETEYSNEPLATLDTTGTGTEYEYILTTGFGEAKDYEGIDLTGKVVFCSRGTTSFFEKGDVAAELGAAAIIIYNNQAGIINMDLTDYSHTAPCVSIAQTAGQAILAASTPATTEAGLEYYTGKVIIDGQVRANMNNSPYYTMSSFSSWGVPGDLSLKPEITAPGGSIYSIFGTVPGDGGSDKYEIMSGTSMAAPQITGITALVMQYIRENGLSQDGMTDRALAQSLMMSTATPMKDADGNYYPVFQQGAGLANTAAATSADSYVTVEGQPDGKVKAELKDDPKKDGIYTFDFTLTNISKESKVYELTADVFTQDAFLYYANANMSLDQTALFQDLVTVPLEALVSWEVDGKIVNSAGEMANYDFDGNGTVNELDADALMAFVTGEATTISAEEYADLNLDGEVNTYDVYLFLAKLGNDTVTVPAGDSKTITVTIELTDAEKEYLDYYYTAGAYVEAYVFADALSTEEGDEGTSHSIPVLAFYGNWTDSSMFDKGNYQTYSTGEEFRTPYVSSTNSNTFAITYGDEPDAAYYFGGNPLVPDAQYLPERNAMNAERGDSLVQLSFVAIRNAASSRFAITQGDTVIAESFPGAVSGAYYYSNGGTWRNTGYNLNIGWGPEGMAEGDRFEASLTLAPELYLNADGSVNWDELGEGASITTPVVIDNTAPTMGEVTMSLTGNTLTVEASDNQYVAAVVLYNASGAKALAYTGSKMDAVPGETYEYTLDLSDVNGKKFLLQVADYAMNVATYEIEMQLGEEQPMPEFIAFALGADSGLDGTGSWVSYEKTSDMNDVAIYAPANEIFFAATIADHFIFMVTQEGKLYVAPEDDITNMTYIANIGTVVTDMAYNKADGEIYAVDGENLLTIDKLTGAVEVVGTPGVMTNTLACDTQGNFYVNEYGTSDIYTFTLDTIAEPQFVVECTDYYGDAFTSMYVQSMEWNPNNNMLYWNSFWMFSFWGFTFNYATFIEVDVVNKVATPYEDLARELSCLIIPEKTAGGSWNNPTDEVAGIQLTNAKSQVVTSVNMLRGSKAQLNASVLPWTATDRSVTWTSSDEAVATVNDKGMVTAVAAGTATITATSNLDPSVSTSVEVVVETLELTVKGALQDEDGTPVLFSWNMAEEQTWKADVEMTTSMISADTDGNGNLWVVDGVANVNNIHKVDMATGETLKTYQNTAGLPFADLSISRLFSTEETSAINGIYWYYFLPAKDPANLTTSAFNFSSYLGSYTGGSELIAVTTSGQTAYTDQYGVEHDAELVYMLDDAGYIWQLQLYATETGYGAGLSYFATTLLDAGYVMSYDDNLNPLCSMVIGEDGNFYFSGFNGQTNVLYRLIYNDVEGVFEAMVIGDVGQDVWPAALTQVTPNTPAGGEGGNAFAGRQTLEVMAEPVNFEEIEKTVNTRSMICPTQSDDKSLRNDANAVVEPIATLNRNTKLPVELYGIEEGTECVGKTVTLTLTADEVTTNGLYTVAFDAANLTLTKALSNVQVNSFNAADGTITFGYAQKEALAADTELATFTFTMAEDKEATFTVTKAELNDTKPGTEEVITLTGLDHDYVITVVPATCTEGGYTLYTCADCGVSYTDQHTEALGHNWNAGTVTKAPNCTEEGTESRTCARCGETETRILEAKGHEFTVTVVPATCTEGGYTFHECACGYNYADNATPALGHTFGEWTEVVAATCDQNGLEQRVCETCGATEQRETGALGHFYEGTVTAPTCTEDGYTTYVCLDCGHTYVSDIVPAMGHDYTVTVVEPTCTEYGYTYHVCETCGHAFTTDVTQPLGHFYEGTVTAPTCTEGGYTTYVCLDCGDTYVADYTDPMGHTFGEWVVTTEPTCTEEGVETRTCHCGETETRTAPAYCPSAAFEDVALDAWYHDAIDYVVENGIMQGMSATEFNPEGLTTRAHLVTVLYRVVGEPDVEGLENPFTDLTEDWYTNAVIWAYNEGVVLGVTETTFAPNVAVTREQMVTILYRFNGEEEVDETVLDAFTDKDTISEYAVEAMAWAVENGIVKGMTETTLAPRGTSTRAQIAAILMRYLEA